MAINSTRVMRAEIGCLEDGQVIAWLHDLRRSHVRPEHAILNVRLIAVARAEWRRRERAIIGGTV